MMADSELAAKLNRQQQRADGEIAPAKVPQRMAVCEIESRKVVAV